MSEPNVPVPAALADADGLKVHGRSGDQVMDSLTEGRVDESSLRSTSTAARALLCRNAHRRQPAADYRCSEKVRTCADFRSATPAAVRRCARVGQASPPTVAWDARTVEAQFGSQMFAAVVPDGSFYGWQPWCAQAGWRWLVVRHRLLSDCPLQRFASEANECRFRLQ